MKIIVRSIILNLFLLFICRLTNARDVLRLGVFNDLRSVIPAMEVALETIEKDQTLPFTFETTYNRAGVSG